MITFEAWWEKHGQFVRAGGGDYEKCFAYAAWNYVAAPVAPPGAQEVHFFRQRGSKNWTECDEQNQARITRSEAGDCFEFRALYTAPVPATTPAEQPEGDPSHVMRPFGAPAGQHDWIRTGERLPEQREHAYQVVAICAKKYGDNTNYPGQGERGVQQDWVVRRWPQNFVAWMPLPPFSDQSEASRCRAPGGITDNDSTGEGCATATNTNQPEGEKGGAAPATWQPVTRAGQVKKGDKLRFTIGDTHYSERVKMVLDPGTNFEEVVYNKSKNFYFITAMVVGGRSNHKNVEFLGLADLGAANTNEGGEA